MKENEEVKNVLNTMPGIQFKFEDEIKSQLQNLISEFFMSYRHMSYRHFLPFELDGDYFIPQHEAHYGFNYPYEYFMRNMKWSDDMVNDVANCFLQQMLNRFTDLDIQSKMADDLKVLLDDDMSKRWLCRIAKAERTSIAYERSMRLIGDGKNVYHNVIASEILQKAADGGDDMCAMYLIDKHYNQCRDNEAKIPSLQYARGVLYAEIGDISTAKSILQEAADKGDVESAMYLISQTFSTRNKGYIKMNTTGNETIKTHEGLNINWSEEKIFSFLLKRYDIGDERAKQLLEEHLKNYIDSQIGDCENKAEIRKQKINETEKGYPLSVIQDVLKSDFCAVQNSSSSISPQDFYDDVPF